jgi:hypothetical protein
MAFCLTNFRLPAASWDLGFLGVLNVGQRIDEGDQLPLHPRILDAGESPVQLQPLAAVEKIHDIGSAFLGKTGRLFLTGDTFKKKANVNLQELSDLLEAARADSVRAFFVFLHLLEGQPERLAELFLTEPQKHAPQTDATADMPVDVIG